jgi:hypothetical protein
MVLKDMTLDTMLWICRIRIQKISFRIRIREWNLFNKIHNFWTKRTIKKKYFEKNSLKSFKLQKP